MRRRIFAVPLLKNKNHEGFVFSARELAASRIVPAQFPHQEMCIPSPSINLRSLVFENKFTCGELY